MRSHLADQKIVDWLVFARDAFVRTRKIEKKTGVWHKVAAHFVRIFIRRHVAKLYLLLYHYYYIKMLPMEMIKKNLNSDHIVVEI